MEPPLLPVPPPVPEPLVFDEVPLEDEEDDFGCGPSAEQLACPTISEATSQKPVQ
jgi:hypothetical protein